MFSLKLKLHSPKQTPFPFESQPFQDNKINKTAGISFTKVKLKVNHI